MSIDKDSIFPRLQIETKFEKQIFVQITPSSLQNIVITEVNNTFEELRTDAIKSKLDQDKITGIPCPIIGLNALEMLLKPHLNSW